MGWETLAKVYHQWSTEAKQSMNERLPKKFEIYQSSPNRFTKG